jgi:transketolase
MHPNFPPDKYQSIRDEFGRTVVDLGRRYAHFVVLTADLMYPTRTDEFAAKFPERFFDVGVAEQNLVGIAAGLASCGKLPLVADYANFLCLRAGEQVRNDVAYTNLNVKLAALSSGLTFGVGGPSHQSYEDISLMRALPNLVVIVASDALATRCAVEAAVEHFGPVFLRLGRDEEKIVYRKACDFAIGRAIHLREGKDVAIIANGPMVAEAVEAADQLRKDSISARVLDMHTIKPIDGDAILESAASVRVIVTVEEHNVIGGLGSAVLEVLGEQKSCPVVRIGIPDVFPIIGPTFELRQHLGLCAANVVAVVEKSLACAT